MSKIILLGATGLVGGHAVRLLLEDPCIESVLVFGRRPCGLASTKLTEHIVDFDRMDSWAHLIQGDTLILSLGTTKKQAGSADEQYKVDYTYQFDVAKAARKNGVASCIVVSSSGANHSSPFFYLRMKGSLEKALGELEFEFLNVVQPSALVGERASPRFGERVGITVLRSLQRVPGIRRYRPILGGTVAKAIQTLVHRAERFESDSASQGFARYSLDALFELAGEQS